MTSIGLHHRGSVPKPPLHYSWCGLNDVYLLSGYEREKTPYGEGISIQNVDELHKAIGLFLVSNRKLLSGREVRFLRQEMDLTQSELARFFGCSAQQVARYEKDESKMPGAADRILRLLYKEHMHQNYNVRELLAVLDELDDVASQKLTFEQTEEGWKRAE